MKPFACLIYRTIVAISVTGIVTPNAFCSSQSLPGLGRWFVGAGGGAEGVDFSGTKVNSLLTDSTGLNPNDIFTMSNNTEIGGVINATVGYRFRSDVRSSNKKAMSVFLEYDNYLPVSMSGTRLQYGTNPSAFTYDLGWQALLLGFKWDAYQWDKWMPYLEAGFGVSANSFSNYVNNTTPSATLPVFPNNTNYQMSYVIGLGIEWLATHNWLFSAGYRFGYWGYLQSGNMPLQNPPPAPVALSYAIYSNEATVKMSYLFSS